MSIKIRPHAYSAKGVFMSNWRLYYLAAHVEKGPYTAFIITTESKLGVTVSHGHDLGDTIPTPYPAADSRIDEGIAVAIKLHPFWIRENIFSESQRGNCYWFVNLCHFALPARENLEANT